MGTYPTEQLGVHALCGRGPSTHPSYTSTFRTHAAVATSTVWIRWNRYYELYQTATALHRQKLCLSRGRPLYSVYVYRGCSCPRATYLKVQANP